MGPEQLGDYLAPSDPNIHPDGSQVVFVVSRADLEDDHYRTEIWRWAASGAAPFTVGPADRAPRWSPDGSVLAFLRAPEPGGHHQVAVMPSDGGEPRVVTEFALGVSELEWSPDGMALAVIASEWVVEVAKLDDDERARLPRRITRLPFREDNKGWTHDRRSHLWIVEPVATGLRQCLTPGDFDEAELAWSASGDRLAFISARHEGRSLDAGSQVFSVPRDGEEARARSGVGTWSRPSFSPSGDLYAIGDPERWGHPTTSLLYRLDGTAHLVTTELDRNLAVPAPPTAPSGLQWLGDGTARCLIEDSGSVTVNMVTSDGEVTELIGGRQVITGASFTSDGTKAAYLAGTSTNPGELWIWDGTNPMQVSDLNGAFASAMVAPTTFTIDHEGVSIDGWIYVPAGDDVVPVLLNIHGGPATQYGWGFFDEFQIYVGAGYGVVATNPRGSSGYGRDHVRAVFEQWQTASPPDLRDLAAAVDAACAVEPRLDPERVGVMGGSYGGLMTVELIAHDQRYRSAVAERGLYTWNSFAGTSDIGSFFPRMYLGAAAADSTESMWEASPLRGLESITTPTLIIHSENDFRCPIEQAEQLFSALLRAGTVAEFLRFPGESHELSRSGKPRHRLERFEAIIDWHGRFL